MWQALAIIATTFHRQRYAISVAALELVLVTEEGLIRTEFSVLVTPISTVVFPVTDQLKRDAASVPTRERLSLAMSSKPCV